MQLMLVLDTPKGIALAMYTLVEKNIISQLIVELYEIAVSPVNQTLVEEAVWQTELIGLTSIASL
jgi:hypothetical protein